MPAINEPISHLSLSTSKDWREQAGHYRLIGSKCSNCGEMYFPQRWACPKCHSNQLEEYHLKPIGEVITSSIIYGVKEETNPMLQAVIKLQDGPIIAAEIIDANTELEPGSKVEMTLRKTGRNSIGAYLYAYKFRPLGAVSNNCDVQ